jgi:tetratricopeptide (TPR) repeat protein
MGAPEHLDARFAALSPGQLDNTPQTLTLTLTGAHRRAVPANRWPGDRRGPEPVLLDGVPFKFEAEAVPEVKFEVVVTYVRAAAGGEAPPPEPGASLGELRAGGDRPEALPPASTSLEAGRAALEAGDADLAEEHARRAIAADPSGGKAWTLLAEAAALAGRPAEATARARWANALAPQPLAWLVVAEAALANGEIEEAAAAVAALDDLVPEGPPAALAERLAKVRAELE